MSGCQSCQDRSRQHVEAAGFADYLLRFRHAVVVCDQHAALLEVSRDLGGIEAVAVAPPRLSTDQDAVGLDVPVKKLGRTLPKFVSLADRHPFTAASANVDEAIAETGHKLALNLACADAREGDIETQLGEIDKANPAVAIGSCPSFNPQHGPHTNVVLRARDVQKLAQPKRAVEDMLERVRRAQSSS